MIEWLLLAAGGLLVAGAFWDQIRAWLQTVVADFVERTGGYKARQVFLKGLVVFDRVLTPINAVTARLVAWVRGPRGKVHEATDLRLLQWHEVPPEVRERLLQGQPVVYETDRLD